MKLHELESRVDEVKLANPLTTLRKGVDAVKKLSQRFGNKADDATPRIDPDFDPTKLPNIDKPRIRQQPGETIDDAIARMQAEKTAADAATTVPPTTVTPPKAPSTPSPGTDVKDMKRGFKDRISDKLSGRKPGTPTVTSSPSVELPKNIDIPPKMRKPAPETPAVKAADEVPAVKASDEVPAVKASDEVPAVGPTDKTLLRRGAEWTGNTLKNTASKHPWYTLAGAGAGVAAADAKLSSATNDADFETEFKKNLGINTAPLDKEGNAGVPASTSSGAPENDPDYIPPATRKDESLATLLKLTGQRPITERDSTMGIIKPKAIQTLTESQSIAECGMGMNSSQPASISINATAGSGDEVANMLASIMKLAGVRPVEQDMMPQQNSNMPMMKALQIMGGPDEMLPPSDPDSMNANLGADEIELAVGDDSQSDGDGSVTVRNIDTGEEHVGHDVTEPGSITVRNVDTGEEFKGKESTDEQFSDNFKANTTPNDPTDVPKFDSNKMADMRNFIDMSQIPAGAPGDNKLPKQEPKLQESSSTDLFKAYEAFKNGN